MAIQRRWKLMACAILLAGVVLAGVLGYGRFGVQRPGGNPMNDSRFMVDHVRRTTDKPFDDVAKAFEAQLGKFDGDVRKAATASEDAEEAKAKIAAMAGPSGATPVVTRRATGRGCENRKISFPRTPKSWPVVPAASGPASQATSSATARAGTVSARSL